MFRDTLARTWEITPSEISVGGAQMMSLSTGSLVAVWRYLRGTYWWCPKGGARKAVVQIYVKPC